MSEEPVVIATSIALRKGGSLQVTIPKEVVKFLNLEPGDYIMFIHDPKTNRIFIDKVEKVVDSRGLAFSLSKKVLKRLLQGGHK